MPGLMRQVDLPRWPIPDWLHTWPGVAAVSPIRKERGEAPTGWSRTAPFWSARMAMSPGAAEMRQPAMYAGVPDLPIVTKVRPRLETRLHCPKCGSRDVVLMFMIPSDQ